MCLKCHQGLSNAQIESQLIDALQEPHFSEWNGTSIHHMAIAGFGVNGPAAQKYAIELLRRYIEYKKTNVSKGDGTFFGNPTHTIVQTQLDKVIKFNEIATVNNLTTADIHAVFYHHKEPVTNSILKSIVSVCNIILGTNSNEIATVENPRNLFIDFEPLLMNM